MLFAAIAAAAATAAAAAAALFLFVVVGRWKSVRLLMNIDCLDANSAGPANLYLIWSAWTEDLFTLDLL